MSIFSPAENFSIIQGAVKEGPAGDFFNSKNLGNEKQRSAEDAKAEELEKRVGS